MYACPPHLPRHLSPRRSLLLWRGASYFSTVQYTRAQQQGLRPPVRRRPPARPQPGSLTARPSYRSARLRGRCTHFSATSPTSTNATPIPSGRGTAPPPLPSPPSFTPSLPPSLPSPLLTPCMAAHQHWKSSRPAGREDCTLTHHERLFITHASHLD